MSSIVAGSRLQNVELDGSDCLGLASSSAALCTCTSGCFDTIVVPVILSTKRVHTFPDMSSLVSAFSRHTLKQLKFVLPGGLLTYYFDSHNALLRILGGEDGVQGWGRCVRRVANIV